MSQASKTEFGIAMPALWFTEDGTKLTASVFDLAWIRTTIPIRVQAFRSQRRQWKLTRLRLKYALGQRGTSNLRAAEEFRWRGVYISPAAMISSWPVQWSAGVSDLQMLGFA